MIDQAAARDYLTAFGFLAKAPASTPAKSRPGESAGTLRDSAYAVGEKSALMDFQRFAKLPVTGVLDDATKRAMERPRCGMPDRNAGPRSLEVAAPFVASGSVWKKAIITWAFENHTADLTASKIEQIFQAALDRWAGVVPLVFRRGAAADADIRIAFRTGNHGDGSPFDGSGKVLAHAFFPSPNVLAGDVHYDDDEKWQEGVSSTGFDLLTVTVHELGHALGLRHTDVAGSTMNPFYPTPSTPQADDKAGIRSIYREHIWIASMYRDLLGRRFDDGGFDFWVTNRHGGMGKEAIAKGFVYSEEHSRALAADLYRTLLDREPDPGGLDFWTAQLQAGASRQSVVLGFLTSDEYAGRFPSNEAWVESLYQKLLRRSSDPGGFQFWVGRIAAGASRAEVANGFLNSDEYCRARAARNYQTYLRREPDEGGLAGWAAALQGGLPHQDLDAGFLVSDEYRANATAWWS